MCPDLGSREPGDSLVPGLWQQGLVFPERTIFFVPAWKSFWRLMEVPGLVGEGLVASMPVSDP